MLALHGSCVILTNNQESHCMASDWRHTVLVIAIDKNKQTPVQNKSSCRCPHALCQRPNPTATRQKCRQQWGIYSTTQSVRACVRACVCKKHATARQKQPSTKNDPVHRAAPTRAKALSV
jgi:hypothetical protein